MEGVSSSLDTQWVVVVIAHELAHQVITFLFLSLTLTQGSAREMFRSFKIRQNERIFQKILKKLFFFIERFKKNCSFFLLNLILLWNERFSGTHAFTERSLSEKMNEIDGK